jgi:hypothetical protein
MTNASTEESTIRPVQLSRSIQFYTLGAYINKRPGPLNTDIAKNEAGCPTK